VRSLALSQLVALIAFGGTYLGLALGRLPLVRVDRTGVAVIGAVMMVAGGVIPWDEAVASVDVHTLALLFGMMIVAAYLRLSGFFALVTVWAVRRARTPQALLGAVILVAGVLSALFVNDIVCLVLAPLVLELVRQLRLPPLPYLIALATASNVGSVATLTGNPQNMLVGSFSGIAYRSFLWRQAPVALAGLILVFLIVRFAYRRELPERLEPVTLDERFRVHHALMLKTSLVVLVMLAAFLVGLPIALVALSGAAYALITRRVKPDKVYREVNWQLLVLFTGLFVVMRGIEATGLTRPLLAAAAALGLERPLVLTTVTAVVSNVVSNVPAVLLLRPVIAEVLEPSRAWLLVAMASTLAGNLTLVGSVANLIVVEVARAGRIRIGFLEYARVGVPLTLATLLLGWGVLSLLPPP
jgi:Na+/H+ antiporter NhaD/arsenite permease-like protein